ncbi:MAG: heme-dependent peroxidase [Thermaerobacter sp.]|nr:heme-dependent peroxidase [Thermaerobacter sp.]
MSEAVETLEGWYALHDFRRIDWAHWQSLDARARQQARSALLDLAAGWSRQAAGDRGSYGIYQVLGHKADLLLLNFRADPGELAAIESELDRSPAGALLTRAYSYFSVVELSKYLARGEPNPDANPYLKSRLQPAVPPWRTVCFYPMNKRRAGADNWYMLPREQRRDMMKSHGLIGQRYHDRVIQVITGSQGLDDWEWGVTLFADDLVAIKKLVYEMRFDEVSARFADFGPFYLGLKLTPEAMGQLLA